LIAARVQPGRVTAQVKDSFQRLIGNAFAAIIRDHVNDRLTTALNASAIPDPEPDASPLDAGEVITTEEEISGFRIVQAIAAQVVDPRRIAMRDAKSYCAILLDDNNRKPIARLHFNGITTKYIGTFDGKAETKHLISDLADIYKMSASILEQIKLLNGAAESV
jgi:hypothetical protein